MSDTFHPLLPAGHLTGLEGKHDAGLRSPEQKPFQFEIWGLFEFSFSASCQEKRLIVFSLNEKKCIFFLTQTLFEAERLVKHSSSQALALPNGFSDHDEVFTVKDSMLQG